MSAAEIITIDKAAPALPQGSVNPASVIQMYITSGKDLDIEKITKLLELQERFQAFEERREAHEAKKAYYAAMAQFKKNAPTITKNKTVSYDTQRGTTTEYDHATLDHICEMIIPALAAVGITHKWIPSNQSNGEITITCLLTHEWGFSDPDPATIRGPLDTSGSKNAIQSIGSSASYLERYTLMAAVGMAAKGVDNDGNQPEAEPEKTKQPDPIKDAATLDQLMSAYRRLYSAAEADNNKPAMKAIREATNARKAELMKAGAQNV